MKWLLLKLYVIHEDPCELYLVCLIDQASITVSVPNLNISAICVK